MTPSAFHALRQRGAVYKDLENHTREQSRRCSLRVAPMIVGVLHPFASHQSNKLTNQPIHASRARSRLLRPPTSDRLRGRDGAAQSTATHSPKRTVAGRRRLILPTRVTALRIGVSLCRGLRDSISSPAIISTTPEESISQGIRLLLLLDDGNRSLDHSHFALVHMHQSVKVVIQPTSCMTAHQDNHHSVQRLQFTRPETESTDVHQAARSPSDGMQAHRRKIRRVSPRSVSQGSQSSEEEVVDDEQMMDDDAFIAARNSSSRKMPLPAAHEIKYLRHEAAILERQFRLLCAKWKTHLPEEHVRLRACEAAKQKTITMQVERINAELKQQLLQQQLYFSSLQSSLSESPLWQSNKNCQAIYRDIHYELKLKDNGEAERRAALQSRFETALREAPRTVDRYTIDHIHSTAPAIPYSHTSTSGTEEFTFLSNVFMCKIPNATMEQVFQAALDHYRQLPDQLNRHLAMDVSSKPILSLDETRHYSQLEYGSGDFAGVRSNVTFQAEMVNPQLAVMVVDLVDEDELHPSNSANQLSKDGLSILTLTPVHDESTGQNCILLRRLLVHRYNLLPNSSRLHKEVNSLVSYVNGDLSMAIVCQALQANARKSDENR